LTAQTISPRRGIDGVDRYGRLGQVNIRRAYGNFAKRQSGEVGHDYQQNSDPSAAAIRCLEGGDTTDMAMTIGIDLLLIKTRLMLQDYDIGRLIFTPWLPGCGRTGGSL
jgi:hypothetical protein